MWNKSLSFIGALLLALIVVGCPNGGDSDGTGGTPTDPDLADHQTLATCGDDSGCPEAFVQCIEAPFAQCEGEFVIRDVECLLIALREGSPGLYRIELDETNAGGSRTRDYTFAITPSGAVENGAVSLDNNAVTNEFFTDYLPTERCDRKAAQFYDDCLGGAGGAGGIAVRPDCVFPPIEEGLRWFENCVPQSPTCE